MASISNIDVTQNTREFSIVPSLPLDVLDSVVDKLESMEDELVDPMKLESVTRQQINSMARNSPLGFRFATDVHCHGAELTMGSAGEFVACSYETEGGAKSPQDHQDRYGSLPTVQGTRPNGITETTATVRTTNSTAPKGLGRTRGYNGWDDTGDIMIAQLASFQHNFQGLLLGYDEVPEIPVNEPWRLPNLVLNPEVAGIEQSYNASISEPKQLAPSARYKYNFGVPTPVISFNIGIQAPNRTTKGYIQFMDPRRNQIALTEELDIPEGSSNIRVTLRGRPFEISNGLINFNPSNAPEGVTVESVSSFPPSIL